MKHYGPKKKRVRAPLNEENYSWVRARLAIGENQHDIAAELGWNQGRVSEINTGKRGNPNQLSLI